MKHYIKNKLEGVAEVHFFLRPMLVNKLKEQKITQKGKSIVGNYDNCYQFWTGSENDHFFDMSTFIRLSSAIENSLKEYYMDQKGYSNLTELKNDNQYSRNIFQRVHPWHNRGAVWIYEEELGYDLNQNPCFESIQETVLHRHLYAHNSGLIDDEYIDRLERLTGQDLLQEPKIKSHYPQEDVYWFQPLNRLSEFINKARNFFSNFP